MSVKYLYYRWAVDLKNFTPSLSQLTSACLFVQTEEKTRLMKFHFIDDFLSSLVGRLLMRKFISETTNLRYNEIIFDRDVRGKPYLKFPNVGLPPISFNVSHHGSMVVLAGVTVDVNNANDSQHTLKKPDFAVGIDVMKIEYTGGQTLSNFFRIMTRNFSDSEWRYIKQDQNTEQDSLKAFIRHWCLKESYVKNIGVGLTVDLQKISFSIQDDLETDKIVTSTGLCVNGFPARKNCSPSEKGEFKFFSFDELLLGSGVDTGAPATEESEEYSRNVLQKERKQLRS